MATIAERKYAHYTTRVGMDSRLSVEYDEVDGQLARFTCRIFRVPSREEFTVRNRQGATADDRRKAERLLALMPRGEWAEFPPELWTKQWCKDGYYVWILDIGWPVCDPLVQLELEMMIDFDSELRRDLAA